MPLFIYNSKFSFQFTFEVHDAVVKYTVMHMNSTKKRNLSEVFYTLVMQWDLTTLISRIKRDILIFMELQVQS